MYRDYAEIHRYVRTCRDVKGYPGFLTIDRGILGCKWMRGFVFGVLSFSIGFRDMRAL